MTLLFVALSAFLIGDGVTGGVARYFFLMGWEYGRDDRVLDPGEMTGRLPAVGESSGRHALPDWPDDMDTEQLEAVTT